MRHKTRSPRRAGINLLLTGCLLLATGTAHAATPAQVEAAMKKAVDGLYAHQANGNWEVVPARTTQFNGTNGWQYGGLTALSTYALLSSGENESDKRLAAAIKFLVENPSQGVYASAVRCLVWSRIQLTPALHVAAQKDVNFLLKAINSKGEARGLFFYGIPANPTDVRYDHSVSQLAALGLSVMAQKGFDIPPEVWTLTEQAWQKHQAADGGWGYDATHLKTVTSMTAAGVATLFVTQSFLSASGARQGNADDAHIRQGMDWLGKNFDATFDVSREDFGSHFEPYALFAISRVGVASGLRYFGTVDWYQRGADYLIGSQAPEGSWSSEAGGGTALGLLFLAYGSSPVAVEKLEYASTSEGGKPAIAQWNQRPQDLLNFMDWMGHQLEHRLNWQVVNLSSSIQVLHEAPILFISGSGALSFSETDRATLRQYLDDGGMIVGNADNDGSAFSASFMELGKQLLPAYEFRELPPSHPIYTNEQYRTAKFSRPVRMQGLSNGVRELMLLPAGDLSHAFQHRSDATQPDSYHLFDDIVLYSMDTSGLERKGNSYLVLDNPKAPVLKTLKVARLQYDGNWDPEPGGWRRLAAILHNSQKIALKAQTVKLGDGSLITPPAPTTAPARPSDAEMRQLAMKRIPPADLLAAMAADPTKAEALIKSKIAEIRAELDAADALKAAGQANLRVAHLTGTEPIKLTDAGRAELKKFVDAGGTLIIDAAGGSTAFASSIEPVLAEMFGADAKQLDAPLGPDAPIYHQAGHIIDAVQYRQFARSRISSAKTPQLRGIQIRGRLAVIYSREDLGAGLVGEPVDGITGYTPASATELMTDILLNAK